MKCKECKGKMMPDLRIDVLGYHYFWRCQGCDREVKLDKVVARRILWPQLPPKTRRKKEKLPDMFEQQDLEAWL